MKIYDISRTLSPAIAVWPGDRPFRVEPTMLRSQGDSVNVSAISMSVHAGTHADAPYHVDDSGPTAETLPLEKFLGPAAVVDVGDAPHIGVEHLRGVDLARTPRVLFKTSASALPDEAFPENFPALTPELAEFLGERGAVLVGTDAPSVDPSTSRTLEVHRILARYGIVNLENLQLRGVPPGEYELIALPLKIAGADASPLRAVLLSPSDASGEVS